MEVTRAVLVVADISGYTRFLKLHTVSLIHAEVIISELLETILDHTDYPLTLSKLEGDAALLYMSLDGVSDVRVATQEILKQVQKFIDAFKTRERELIACNVCVCEACVTMGKLKVKAFLHVGDITIKKIRQFEDLGGEDVIVIHRLMKNTVPAHEYILMTEAFYELSGGLTGQTPEARVEECEGIGSVPVRVYYPVGDEPPLPTPPSLFSPPSAEYVALSKRFEENLQRRLQGGEPPQPFNHLPQVRLTWLDRVKMEWEGLVFFVTEIPKIWFNHHFGKSK